MDIKKKTLAVFVGMMVSGGVWAVAPPSAPKTDDTVITLSVKDGSNSGDGDGFVMLRQLDPTIELGLFDNDNAKPSDFADFCIYASGVGGKVAFDVNLLVTGSTDGDGAFALTGNIPENRVNYTVDLYSAIGGTVEKEISDLSQPTLIPTAFGGLAPVGINENLVCDGLNASVRVSVSTEELSAAPADDYSDTLTLTVSAS